jgi:hypothetical protein
VKKRWDDGASSPCSDTRLDLTIPFFPDLIFKNQAISTREKPAHFVNDLLRTEFHKFALC